MIRPVLLAICLTVWAASAHANDAAAETAVGGIRLRKEHSIVMEKERLFISEELVRVEYEFRNTSKKSITSEVAFPIPPFGFSMADAGGPRGFADFQVWVDDKPIPIKEEVRAFVDDREVTKPLRKAGITIEQFGRIEDDMGYPPEKPSEIRLLSSRVRGKLIRVGALEAPDPEDKGTPIYWPRWDTHLTYHWRQIFPPGKVVRVKHEYRPVIGFEHSSLDLLVRDHPDAVLDPETRKSIKMHAYHPKDHPEESHFFLTWVKYILTTANTWQGPIRDFELTVQMPNENYVALFDWDGPLERIDPRTYHARRTDFVPTREFCVYFLRSE